MAPHVVNLFAGSGGWEVAAGAFGLVPLGIEVDGPTCAVRDAAGLATLQADVMALDPADFGPIVGLIASAPCQTWSSGGGRAAVRSAAAVAEVLDGLAVGEDRRHIVSVGDDRDLLVVEPLRWALALRPRWIALEQVTAVLPVWNAIALILADAGWQTWTGVVNARDFGVAQDRERAVLLASLDDPVDEPRASAVCVRPCDLFDGWADDDVIGFPRRADRGASVELGGVRYRARDLRSARKPAFTLTSKSRSWLRITQGGERHRLELDEAVALQGFPPDYPFAAAGSRSAAFERLADTVPPPLAWAALEVVVGERLPAVA